MSYNACARGWLGQPKRHLQNVKDRVRRFTAQDIYLRFCQVMGLIESTRILRWCQLFACTLFAMLFGWYSFQGEFLIALVYFSGFFVIGLLRFSDQNCSKKSWPKNNWSTKNRPKNSYLILSTAVFSIYTLASLAIILLVGQQGYSLHLSLLLAYPLLALSLLPFRLALFFILFFSVVANLLLMLQLEGAFRAAYLTAFWLVTLLTLLHNFAHSARQEALKQQLNRDIKTQLLNQDQLIFDLKKEQARAQREATFLGVIFIVNKSGFDLPSANEVASYFSAYEELYSLTANQLVALIPLAASSGLKNREAKLAIQFPNLSVSSQLSTEEQLITDYLQAYIGKLEVER